jgi:hypothetical protein
MHKEQAANFILRVGVAFAFLFPAIDEIFDPYSWLGYFPRFVLQVSRSVGIPDLVLLHSFGALEVIIALWILSNKKLFLPSLAAVVILLVIIVTGLSDFQILFRDVTIAAAALALAVGAWDKMRGATYT